MNSHRHTSDQQLRAEHLAKYEALTGRFRSELDESSSAQDARGLRQVRDNAYQSLFQLAFPFSIPQSFQLLPEGSLMSKAPLLANDGQRMTTTEWLKEAKDGQRSTEEKQAHPFIELIPEVVALKNDDADEVRVLAAIARYAITMLNRHPENMRKKVAREISEWPMLVGPDNKSRVRVAEQTKRLELGEACPVILEGKNLNNTVNRVLLSEINAIHQYLIWPDDYEREEAYLRQQTGQPIWGETRDPDGEWTANVIGWDATSVGTKWKQMAAVLPPLSHETWEKWWDVIWQKLTEERETNGKFRIKPRYSGDYDLVELGLGAATEAAKNRHLDENPKGYADAGMAKKMQLSTEEKWTGDAAARIGRDGTEIESAERTAAKFSIRKQLRAALQKLVGGARIKRAPKNKN